MRSSLVLVLALFAAACGGGGSGSNPYGGGGNPVGPTGGGSNNTVSTTAGLAFTPNAITISSGDSVKWTFGGTAHTVTFQQGATNPSEYGGGSSAVTPPSDIPATSNASVTRVFATAGVYHYKCSIHPQMLGTVTVQ